MPDSTELLDVARALSTTGAPTSAALRRAVSSVYYAVFHKILHDAGRRFLGPDQEETAAYGILYRSFNHRHMKMVCEALQSTTLRDKYRRPLGRTAVSQDMREFAQTFPRYKRLGISPTTIRQPGFFPLTSHPSSTPPTPPWPPSTARPRGNEPTSSL